MTRHFRMAVFLTSGEIKGERTSHYGHEADASDSRLSNLRWYYKVVLIALLTNMADRAEPL